MLSNTRGKDLIQLDCYYRSHKLCFEHVLTIIVFTLLQGTDAFLIFMELGLLDTPNAWAGIASFSSYKVENLKSACEQEIIFFRLA